MVVLRFVIRMVVPSLLRVCRAPPPYVPVTARLLPVAEPV